MTSQLTGTQLVAGEETGAGEPALRSVDARTGEPFGPDYREATADEVAGACTAAQEAFAVWGQTSTDDRAQLLHAAADELDGLGDALVDLVDRESGLGRARAQTELARASGQFRFLAGVLDEGSFVEAIIDTADPAAQPPRPDIRRMLVPTGPVAVFGASNFPLAFSVPGGDTASALAAGCPVVVKGHPSHPGTSELSARAIAAAVERTGAPPGVFSMVQGAGTAVGEALVTAPQITAVGFTGSERGGRALVDLASRRPEPIPVYAEMGSLNPLVVTPGALDERAEDIAAGFAGSMTQGTGQFCTKPGLLFVPDGPEADAFARQVADTAAKADLGPMLNEGLRDALAERVAVTAALDDVEVLTGSQTAAGRSFPATVLRTSAAALEREPGLLDEHFGPVAIVVTYPDEPSLLAALRRLPGSLAATIHAGDGDDALVDALHDVLWHKAGRLVWNGYPTGVAVTHAMHHGGPYPATASSLHTSVGATALRRFLRPVAYQNTPERHLPPALRDDNPLGITRQVNGRWTDAAVTRS